jgi:p-aminobenzoyl-glutamate transporter AbgT
MHVAGVNLLAVLVAAIATMVIGFLWYSPMLFARPWMVLMGYNPDDKAALDEMRKGAGKNYAIAFVLSLISAFVLGKIIQVTTVEPHSTD